MTVSDEMLSAYLDGALSDETCAQLEAAMAHDPDMADRLERLALNDDRVRAAFAEIDALPMPAAVTDLLDQAATRKTEADASNVVPLSILSRVRPAWQAWGKPSALAASLAASLAAVVGFGIGASMMKGPAADPFGQALAGRGPAIAMLASAHSGEVIDLKSGVTGQVTLTFAAQDGAMCREFQLTSAARTASAVACRTPAEDWSLRLVALHAAPKTSQGGYATASTTQDEAFGTAVDTMMAGDALDSQAEADLVKSGWGRKK